MRERSRALPNAAVQTLVCRVLVEQNTTAVKTSVFLVVFLHEVFVFGGEAFPLDGGLGDVVVESLAAFLEGGEIGLRGGFHELLVDLRLLVFGILDDLLALGEAAFDAALFGEQGVAFRGLFAAAVLARGLRLGYGSVFRRAVFRGIEARHVGR